MPELTQVELQVVALLAAGQTDDAAAARLGCTARTVRRRVADAMAKLGARSRLQLGIELCRRGLVGSATGQPPGAGPGAATANLATTVPHATAGG
jgi:DNA-binding CsgD family transcriptional regulator